MNKATISLCIITYNEENVILRCLTSLYGLIDYYMVIDTGSKDRTKEIIKQFFDEKKINGEIHDGEDFNMSKHLNYAFQKLKGKADFAFYIDSDNFLIIPEHIKIDDFKSQLYHYDSAAINIKNDINHQTKTLFFKLVNNWKWEGFIHEACMMDRPPFSWHTELKVVINNDGHSWTSQSIREKYLRHAGIILNDIELNGITSRNVFYLAQSYRDAGEKEKSIEWYSKRLTMNGFDEEIYMSQVNIALLKWELGRPVMEVADAFMHCSELDELRCEHLYYLKLFYERNGRIKSAVKINELLEKYENPYPKRVLFINPQAYKK